MSCLSRARADQRTILVTDVFAVRATAAQLSPFTFPALLTGPRCLLAPCRHPALKSATSSDKLVRQQRNCQIDSVPRAPTHEHGCCAGTMCSNSDGSVDPVDVCAKGPEADMWKPRGTEHVKICTSQRVKTKPSPHGPSTHCCEVIVARQPLQAI